MVLGCADAACNARSGNFLSKPRAISRTTRHAGNTDSPALSQDGNHARRRPASCNSP